MYVEAHNCIGLLVEWNAHLVMCHGNQVDDSIKRTRHLTCWVPYLQPVTQYVLLRNMGSTWESGLLVSQ